jgi:hypothetical protein
MPQTFITLFMGHHTRHQRSGAFMGFIGDMGFIPDIGSLGFLVNSLVKLAALSRHRTLMSPIKRFAGRKIRSSSGAELTG